MRSFTFILLVIAAAGISTGCEHAHPGGYSAPSKGNGSEAFEQDVQVKIDSSVEKAIAHDTTKRVYKL